MNIIRKAFLFCVGAVAVAYEEANKVIQTQRQKLDERLGKA
jgi:hypothetical protein